MSTRAASAANALRAKQELIRLLSRKQSPPTAASSSADFVGSKSNDNKKKATLDGHRDHHSMYSYANLRSAYLERVHMLHPDKTKHQQLQDKSEQGHQQARARSEGDIAFNNRSSDISKRTQHDDFVALQEAWKRYEELAKASTNSKDGLLEGNFTLFGVGCSFADNEMERAMRTEITDQACRGWFSAGQLEDSVSSQAKDKGTTGDPSLKLSDDDMFVEVRSQSTPEEKSYDTNKSKSNGCSSSNNSNSNGSVGAVRPKSLIDHMIPRNHRKRTVER